MEDKTKMTDRQRLIKMMEKVDADYYSGATPQYMFANYIEIKDFKPIDKQ